MADIDSWLASQPLWLKEAAYRIRESGEITARERKELLALCKAEAEGVVEQSGREAVLRWDQGFGRPRRSRPRTTAGDGSLRLAAIENVVGINALASGNTLDFGQKPLSVVYGGNGAGKSGYMRILKHACDARVRGKLLPDVFAPTDETRRCTIRFAENGESSTVDWTPDAGPVDALRPVAIFDHACESVYVDEEHETVYEPPDLRLLRTLVEVCDHVREALATEQRATRSPLRRTPPEYADTNANQWVAALDTSVSEEHIVSRCAWTEADELRLNQLNRRLWEADPRRTAASLRGRADELRALKRQLAEAWLRLSADSLGELEEARERALSNRHAAYEEADEARRESPFEGVGSSSWRELWEAARRYSETEAYPGSDFPVVAEDSHCVLCQQQLDAATVGRMTALGALIEGEAPREAIRAERKANEIASRLPALPGSEAVPAILDRAGIGNEEERSLVVRDFDELTRRLAVFHDVDRGVILREQLRPQVERRGGGREAVALMLDRLLAETEAELSTSERDARGLDHDRLNGERRELAAQRWLAEQIDAVRQEVERLKTVETLERAKKLAGTVKLSRRASKLSAQLVTNAFEKRFRSELEHLGASRLQLEIKRVRTTKGRVKHRLVLRSETDHEAGAILSEGEKRIASLAACVADFLAEERNVPFVFDDPMSSLDLEHEKRVADRLVRLATERQVIVFTHRLPFVIALNDAARDLGLTNRVGSLERAEWGAGIPGGPPLEAQKPKKALNMLAGERLSAVRKAVEERRLDDVRSRTAELCRDLRIVLENIVEKEILADVVGRFRRAVTTQGKLAKVAKVEHPDCDFIDKMMAKYSRHVHSQPGESPVPLPEADEIGADLARLIEWLAEFSKR